MLQEVAQRSVQLGHAEVLLKQKAVPDLVDVVLPGGESIIDVVAATEIGQVLDYRLAQPHQIDVAGADRAETPVAFEIRMPTGRASGGYCLNCVNSEWRSPFETASASTATQNSGVTRSWMHCHVVADAARQAPADWTAS